jgi:hypothetical protein
VAPIIKVYNIQSVKAAWFRYSFTEQRISDFMAGNREEVISKLVQAPKKRYDTNKKPRLSLIIPQAFARERFQVRARKKY